MGVVSRLMPGALVARLPGCQVARLPDCQVADAKVRRRPRPSSPAGESNVADGGLGRVDRKRRQRLALARLGRDIR